MSYQNTEIFKYEIEKTFQMVNLAIKGGNRLSPGLALPRNLLNSGLDCLHI